MWSEILHLTNAYHTRNYSASAIENLSNKRKECTRLNEDYFSCLTEEGANVPDSSVNEEPSSEKFDSAMNPEAKARDEISRFKNLSSSTE